MTGSTARECGELEELLLYRMGPPKEVPTCQNLRAVVVKCCCFWAEVPRKNCMAVQYCRVSFTGSAFLMAILGPVPAGMVPEVSKWLVSG